MTYFTTVAQVVGAIVGFILAFAGSIYVVRKSQMQVRHKKLSEKIDELSEELGELQQEFTNSSSFDDDFVINIVQNFSNDDRWPEQPAKLTVSQTEINSEYEHIFTYICSIQAKLNKAKDTSDYAFAHDMVQTASEEAAQVLYLGTDKQNELNLPDDISEDLFIDGFMNVMAIDGSDILTPDMVNKNPSKSVLYNSLFLLTIGTIIPIFTTMSVINTVLANTPDWELFVLETIHLCSTLVVGKYTVESLIENLDDII
ncbi:hypothetical protein [Halorubrum sp. BV1]|uniref:hypothetical protein n=1 Tax=Halorubrum sp. BV1 TaxID=1498500 RepID=UPI0012BA7AC6|nr:hypothetical protein [Halorubrum sp. BV1]